MKTTLTFFKVIALFFLSSTNIYADILECVVSDIEAKCRCSKGLFVKTEDCVYLLDNTCGGNGVYKSVSDGEENYYECTLDIRP